VVFDQYFLKNVKLSPANNLEVLLVLKVSNVHQLFICFVVRYLKNLIQCNLPPGK